jgi:hypothetical protein
MEQLRIVKEMSKCRNRGKLNFTHIKYRQEALGSKSKIEAYIKRISIEIVPGYRSRGPGSIPVATRFSVK